SRCSPGGASRGAHWSPARLPPAWRGEAGCAPSWRRALEPTAAGVVTVQGALTQLCRQTEGLRSITVTDRDGVVVLRAPESVIDDQNSEQILTTIFSLTTEQTSKIQELGQANFIMTMYDSCMCLQANHLPLVIRMIASTNANAGALIDMLPHVKSLLESTKEAIAQEIDSY
ncbi:unnamed protein product, partial [Prorocentrum cordatum]